MPEGDEETGYYDVESIVGCRKSERMMRDEYLVKWEGCEEYTFEPVHHLVSALCFLKLSVIFPSDRLTFVKRAIFLLSA